MGAPSWQHCAWRMPAASPHRQCTAREVAFGTLAAETDVCAAFALCRPKHRRCAASLAFRTRYGLLSAYGAFAELQRAALPDAGRVRPSGALNGVQQQYPSAQQQQQQKLSGALAALLDDATLLIARNATDAAEAAAAEAAGAGAGAFRSAFRSLPSSGAGSGGPRRRVQPLPLGCLEVDWWQRHRQLLTLTAAGAARAPAPLHRCAPAPLRPCPCTHELKAPCSAPL